MAKTIIADSHLICDNPLGLATILHVCGQLTNHREFAAIMYTTQVRLNRACYQKTWLLNQIAAKVAGFEIDYAEYSFYAQFKVGTRAAREIRLSAISELHLHMPPRALILHDL